MNKLLALVFAVCCLFAQTAKIGGDWLMTTQTPHGPMKGALQIHQEGDKISGTYVLEAVGTMNLTGKVEGEKVSFSMEIPGAGMTLAFTGKLEGEKMTGSTEHGNWSATRK